jgi:hypothetical protein
MTQSQYYLRLVHCTSSTGRLKQIQADFALETVSKMYNLRNLARGLLHFMSKDFKKPCQFLNDPSIVWTLAQHLMGIMYLYTHKEIVQDNSKAVEWLRLSAHQGLGVAIADLGTCYEEVGVFAKTLTRRRTCINRVPNSCVPEVNIASGDTFSTAFPAAFPRDLSWMAQPQA